MKLTNIIQEQDLTGYLTACQVNKIEVIKKVKMVGMFGTDYQVTINATSPEQLYSLGVAVGKQLISMTDYDKNKCFI